MNTLGQSKASTRINRVAGFCPSSADWLALFNDAVRMLVNRGDFYGTVKKMRACIYGGCITWPREVGTVLAINSCHNSVPLHNHWYEYDRMERHDLLDYWAAGCCGQIHGLQGDTSPVFNPISCNNGSTGVYLRFYPSQPTDVGKIITVFGIDSNGNELRSVYPDGTFQDGVQVPLVLPFATLIGSAPNVSTVRHVTRIIKDLTDGPVHAYQYDAANNILRDLARYEASETLPDYQTTRLGGNYSGACCGLPKTITSLVKLKWIAAVNDNDLVIIDNEDAIAMMMQAIKLDDAYDAEQKRAMEAEAVRELNLQLRNQLPLDQIPVTMSPFGTALPRRHAIGRFV